MIHTIVVTPDTDPTELKKLFRKKLMTGGAVIRLPEALNAEELSELFDIFAPDAAPHNLHSMVLVEIAKHTALTPELQEKLGSAHLPNVSHAISEKRGREEIQDAAK